MRLRLLPIPFVLILAACANKPEGRAALAVRRRCPWRRPCSVRCRPPSPFVARLEAPDTVDVRARVAGTVEAVRFKEGQVVRKGEPLFQLDARAFRAEVARAEAQVSALKTQSDPRPAVSWLRAEKLVASAGRQCPGGGPATPPPATKPEAQLRAAESGLVQAKLNVEYASITAPVTGRTSRANATVGNLVGG